MNNKILLVLTFFSSIFSSLHAHHNLSEYNSLDIRDVIHYVAVKSHRNPLVVALLLYTPESLEWLLEQPNAAAVLRRNAPHSWLRMMQRQARYDDFTELESLLIGATGYVIATSTGIGGYLGVR